MKTAGWIFIVFGAINLFAFFAALGMAEPDAAGTKFGAALMLGVIGGYLLHRGKQKEQENRDRDNWNNS